MENKITMPRLAAMLAIATGKQKRLCEDFLKEIFRIVCEELGNGGNVRIKGFGTFKLVAMEPRKSVNVATGEEHEIPGHNKVIFVAAKELASTVNAPFEAFEAVEVADDIPTDVLLEFPEHVDPEMGEKTESETLVQESDDEGITDGAISGAYGNEEESFDDVQEEEESRKSYRFTFGFLSGFVTASVVALMYFYFGNDFFVGNEIPASVDSVAVAESVAPEDDWADNGLLTDSLPATGGEAAGNDDVPTRPSDELVYDTISTTRFLTTMAKEHYGNFNLWPVIYEENSAILGHPDRIKPGTKVVVPSLEKYGVDPKNPEDVARIKQNGVAIYAKYK